MQLYDINTNFVSKMQPLKYLPPHLKFFFQTVPGWHMFTFVKYRYQIEFNALRFHRFFSHKFCGILVNFFDKNQISMI